MSDFEEGISFILPGQNEGSHIEETLTEIYDALSRQDFRFEMICIDDGSSDDTHAGMLRFGEGRPEAIVHRFDTNIGLGKSTRWGMARIRYDYMMWVPTNAMLDPESMFHKLGDRSEDRLLMFNGDNMATRPLHRKLISKTYNGMMNRYFGIDVEYVHSMLLLPSRRVVLEDSQADRSFFLVELLVLAIRKWGLKPELRRNRIQRPHGVERSKSFAWRNMREIFPAMRKLKLRLDRDA